MAIIEFETLEPITGVLTRGKRGDTYNLIQKRLDASQLQAIRNALQQKIQEAQDSGNEILTAGWIPGSDWRDTPYQSLYSDAAQCNQELAAKMFGLMVWEAFENHEDNWYTGRFEKNGIEIGSRTYFRPRS